MLLGQQESARRRAKKDLLARNQWEMQHDHALSTDEVRSRDPREDKRRRPRMGCSSEPQSRSPRWKQAGTHGKIGRTGKGKVASN